MCHDALRRFRLAVIFSLLLLTALVMAQSAPSPASLPPIRIILVGDSTMAVNSGWGPGFCSRMVPQVTCINRAIGGRSTSSYRAEGSWEKVMDELGHNAGFKATYVLIQFGHNDQPGKPGRSTDLATEFPVNLQRYVQEVKSTGAKPVLITSLTRRWFQNGKVRNDLAPWADATRKVAAGEGVPVLDLNSDSVAAVQKMGPAEANTLAAAPPPPMVVESLASGNSMAASKTALPGVGDLSAGVPPAAAPANSVGELEHHGHSDVPVFDYTHLGEKGAGFFGRMVVEELRQAVPDLQPYLKTP